MCVLPSWLPTDSILTYEKQDFRTAFHELGSSLLLKDESKYRSRHDQVSYRGWRCKGCARASAFPGVLELPPLAFLPDAFGLRVAAAQPVSRVAQGERYTHHAALTKRSAIADGDRLTPAIRSPGQ